MIITNIKLLLQFERNKEFWHSASPFTVTKALCSFPYPYYECTLAVLCSPGTGCLMMKGDQITKALFPSPLEISHDQVMPNILMGNAFIKPHCSPALCLCFTQSSLIIKGSAKNWVIMSYIFFDRISWSIIQLKIFIPIGLWQYTLFEFCVIKQHKL